MKDSLDEFARELERRAPALRAWGEFIKTTITSMSRQLDVIPQIVSIRLKETESAIGKLSRKKYSNPLLDMTDLVGVRIVCLLSPEVSKLKSEIERFPEWDAKLARDPEEEVAQTPDSFGYQSLHFEIRTIANVEISEILVPAGTCCELQVRTLMQHTFAEVVHDNIYKASWNTPTKANRYVSSSSALIETADHLFCETMVLLEEENARRGQLLNHLSLIYDKKIQFGKNKDQKFNRIILDSFNNLIDEDICERVEALLHEKPYIIEFIVKRSHYNAFWFQPVCILIYWLVNEWPNEIRNEWPFADSEESLHYIYSDLGKSFE